MLASVSGDGKALQIEGTACTKRLMPKRASFGGKKKEWTKMNLGREARGAEGMRALASPGRF